MTKDDPIFVTQPWLPPLEEFIPYLEQIWKSKRLANGGPYHELLESALAEYLGVPNIALFANGTLALVAALRDLRIAGEVITTPYSFVATAHSLLWSGIKPVFVDIDPVSFNLDPRKIEAAITPQTTAILAVHVYGRPCDTDAIQSIADTYGLKVIYDAAHAFAVRDKHGSVLLHGDLSILSFHATKVFTTGEGGAIVCHDAKEKRRIEHLKNFGYSSETTVVSQGINGKMNELQAAFGLLQLKHFDSMITRRRAIDTLYRERLSNLSGIRCINIPDDISWNHAYFPVLVGGDYRLTRDELNEALIEKGIRPRRYFYPLITDFPMYRAFDSAESARLPVARRIASEVLCLPIYPALALEDVDRIADVIVRLSREHS